MLPIHALRMKTPATGGGGGSWTPASLSTAAKHWFDAQDAATITQSGSTVSQWNDKGSAAANATQATVANQPSYIASGINSKPILRNPGSADDAMVYTCGVSSITSIHFSGSMTTIEASLEGNARNSGAVYDLSDPSLMEIVWTSGSGTATCTFYENGSQVAQLTGLTHSAAGAVFVIIDAGTAGQVNFGRICTSDRLFNNSAGNRASNADFGEIIMLDYAPSQSDREKIEGYAMWHWAMQASLPGGHPYASAAP